MLGDPVNHNFRGFKTSFEAAAQSLSIEPRSIAVHGADDIDREVNSFAAEGGGGLIITAATFSNVHLGLILKLANAGKLPAIDWNRFQVVAGVSCRTDPIRPSCFAAPQHTSTGS